MTPISDTNGSYRMGVCAPGDAMGTFHRPSGATCTSTQHHRAVHMLGVLVQTQPPIELTHLLASRRGKILHHGHVGVVGDVRVMQLSAPLVV